MSVPLQTGTWEPLRGELTIDGATVRLTTLERRLWSYLVDRPGVTVPYTELLVEVWDAHPAGSIRPIEAVLRRLRRHLGETGRAPVHLHTDHGEGLRFAPLQARAPGAASGRLPLGDLPMTPPAARAWLREYAPSVRSPDRVVERLGGARPILEQVAALGGALTQDALRQLDPMQLSLGDRTVGGQVEGAWGALGSTSRRLLMLLAVFAPPLRPTELCEIADVPLTEVLVEIQTLRSAGWLWTDERGVGVDAALLAWVSAAPGYEEALDVHERFVLAHMDDPESMVRWVDDVGRCRERGVDVGDLRRPGEAWLVSALGADPQHPVDAALLSAMALHYTGRSAEAVERFARLDEPEDVGRRLRWSVVGGALAGYLGDLAMHRRIQEAGMAVRHEATLHQRFQVLTQELDYRHRSGGDLAPVVAEANACAEETGIQEWKAHVEIVYLHDAFQRRPSLALVQRLRDLATEARYGLRYLGSVLVRAERELQLPLTFAEEVVLEQSSFHHGYTVAQATFLGGLALASLPDHGEAQRLLFRMPSSDHYVPRLQRALLAHLLHGDDTGLREMGGQALLDRVRALDAGDASALHGPGWFVLRHALRLREAHPPLDGNR